jgi:membrane protease YdiL (CAAX protease family)
MLIFVFYGALSAAAIGWGAWQGRIDIYRLPSSTGLRMALSPVAGVAFGLVVVFLSRLLTHRFEWARVLHREFHALVHELNSREIFTLAVASAIGEELFFRGALLPVVGVFPSSVLFALLHVRAQPRFLPWTAMSFILGLGMGAMFVHLGDLSGPIAAHFVINFFNLHYISKNELPR